MPQIGDIVRAKCIGKKGGNNYQLQCCIDCGKPRWVRLGQFNPRCRICSGGMRWHDKSPVWKGGRNQTSKGYITVSLKPDDFFYPMADNHHLVREHRLVMARNLGRNLESWEIVHHKNGVRDDNRIENLELVTDKNHIIDSITKTHIKHMERRIMDLESRVTQLEAENIILKSEGGIYA